MIHVTARKFLIEEIRSRKPVVVMFYAAWCGKCASMRPIVEKLERKYYGRIRFLEVEIGESENLASEYGADSVPTFVLFRKGAVYSGMQGVLHEAVLEERIRELL